MTQNFIAVLDKVGTDDDSFQCLQHLLFMNPSKNYVKAAERNLIGVQEEAQLRASSLYGCPVVQ